MSARRPVLALLAAGAAWLLAAASPALAAGGPCDPAQSTLTTNHTSVPADGVWDVTLTATCRDASGVPVDGRTTVIQPSGGSSIVTPASAVTDGSGVATFSVKDATPEGPLTYSAVDEAAGVAFVQTVEVTFVYCDTTIVPVAAIGGAILALLAGGGLAVWQVRRRRGLRSSP